MKSIIDYTNLIDIVASILCLVFGLIFISKVNKKNVSILFLGLFLLVYTSESFRAVLEIIPNLKGNPRLNLLPLNLLLLRHPLILMYVQKLAFLNKKTISKWILLLGLLEFAFFMLLFITNNQIFLYSKVHYTYIIIGNLYMLLFSMYILWWIKKHLIEYGNKYNNLLKNQIRWVSNFVKADMLLGLLLVVFPFFYYPKWLDFIFWLYYFGLTFWIVYRGFYHIGMFDFSTIKLSVSKENVDDSKLLEDFKKIENFLMDINILKNSDLSINDVSKELNLTPNKVSKAINSVYKNNFKAFVNSKRIEYAKKLLLNADYDNFSIDGIANETGFKSRSAFYTAFKANTNCTPAQFKKSKTLQ